ncbi:MAG: toprim domain-containing protein, partial [Muribaculaceae bacterium]|nr:toprim domain-containing protein [Muribaculaceae bacterium]
KNGVASSGTALTEGQIALIHRFTENITVIYDGDPAGIKAALRGVDMLLHRNMKVSVLLLPDGDDPDSFARKNTPEQFREYVRQNETDVISFKAQVLVNDVKNDPNRKIDAIHDMVTSLAHIADPVSRDIYIQTCSTIMDISRETILDAVIKKRTELKEQWRKIRTAEKLSEFDPSNTVIKNNSEKKRDVVANNPKMFRDNQLDVPSPLFPLERKIMEFVVKYGYLPFCPIDNAEADIQEDNSGEKAWMNIAEFIYNELYEDNISISHPVFSKIFSLIFELKSDFIRLRQKRINEIKEEETALRNAGFARIAERNLTIDEIQREEKFLEKEIEQKSKEKLNDFEKFFLIRHLSNYEDDQIRETSTDLAIELYQLSKVYYRDNAEVETEEDRLDILVPRAIDELKSEILNLQLKELYSRLNVAANPDEEHSLLREINEKIHIRSILAKNLGERIVSPHGGEKKNRL